MNAGDSAVAFIITACWPSRRCTFELFRAQSNQLLSCLDATISNDLIHWVRFFSNDVTQTAAKGRDTFRQILALRNEVEHATLGMGRRATAAREVLNLLYRRPIVDAVTCGERSCFHANG